MVAARLALLALSAALLAAAAARAPVPAHHLRLRRQLADDNTLQPLDDASSDDQAREKRKLEGVTQAKFGIKNAVLGFVFGKINSLIDSKTRLVESLDRQNIELNKQYGIEAPKGGGLSSLSGIVGQVIGPKLQFLGPKIQAVTGLLGGASGGGGSEWRYVEAPDRHTAVEGRAGGAPTPGYRGAELLEYKAAPGTGHVQQGELIEYSGDPAGRHQAYRRHPRVRSQQGQPGHSGEPVRAIRVALHPYY